MVVVLKLGVFFCGVLEDIEKVRSETEDRNSNLEFVSVLLRRLIYYYISKL